MNAQEYKLRDEKNPIQLSDKLFIYQEVKEEKETTYWKLFLKKEEEKSTKILEEWYIHHSEIPANLIIQGELEMLIPKLIDAYKEKKNIYVFLNKKGSARLQIYKFDDCQTFKKDEYIIIPFFGYSVAISGISSMSVQNKHLGNTNFVDVYFERQVNGGKAKLITIRENEVYELKFKDNYKTVRFKSPITSFEKEYLSKEIKNQFVKHKLLKEKDRFVYYGYLKDNLAANVRGDGNIYLFYKDENNPLSYQVIKYDISTKEWLINGYQEWRVHSTEDKGW